MNIRVIFQIHFQQLTVCFVVKNIINNKLCDGKTVKLISIFGFRFANRNSVFIDNYVLLTNEVLQDNGSLSIVNLISFYLKCYRILKEEILFFYPNVCAFPF